MENASKALLIAGAVLIVIVLISVGMMIVGASREVTDQVTDTTASNAASAFNSTFNAYLGDKRGSSVKTLLQAISANNATNANSHTITLTGNVVASADATTIAAAAANVQNSVVYTIQITSIDSAGYITGMSINKK